MQDIKETDDIHTVYVLDTSSKTLAVSEKIILVIFFKVKNQ